MAAPAAPAAGGAALTGSLILLACAWVVLYGLLHGYDYSFGALLRKLADSVEDIWVVGGKLADALNSIDHWVRARLADGLEEVEYAMARMWGALEWIVRETGDALVAFGADITQAIGAVVDVAIPIQVTARTKPLARGIDDVGKAGRARDRAEARARARGIDAVNRDLTRESRARERGIDAIRSRLAGVVLPRIRALDHRIDQVYGYTRRTLARRLSRVEQLVLGGAIAAGAIAALTRVFPYWQCTNVRRFNRALCRSPISDWLALLGLLAFVVTALDPVRMYYLADDALDELEGIVREMAGV